MIRNPNLFGRYPPAGFDGQFHWDYLKPAWDGTTITPTDVDALVERHGAFLLFETKDLGVPVPVGQRIAYDLLARMPHFTIVFCAKHPDQITGFEVWGPRGARRCIVGDAADLVAFCRAWIEAQDALARARRGLL